MHNSPRYPGQLDPDFTQVAQNPGWVDLLRALGWSPVMDLFFASAAPARDGALYVCGYFAADTSAPVEYFVTRLHNDGSLDPGFGEQGVVRGSFAMHYKLITPTRLLVQGDGKLLMQSLASSDVAGRPDPVMFVLRLLPDGAPDPAFADRGLLRLDLPPGRYNYLLAGLGDLHLLADGRIQGSHSGVNYLTTPNPKESGVLYRLNADGSLDPGFNGSGLLDLQVSGASLRIAGCIPRADLTTLVVGQIHRPANRHRMGLVARLDASGRLDPPFASDGLLELALSDHHLNLHAIAQRPDGTLIVVGTRQNPEDERDQQGVLIGLTAAGRMDPGFNQGQPLFTPINERYDVQWLQVQAQQDGNVLVAGRSIAKAASFDTYLYLARYLADGRPDPAFGNQGNGRIETHTGGNHASPLEMTRQADGKVLVGLNAGGFRKGTLLRYLA